ncbi:Flagellar hook-associated protein 3 [Caloramator mitchellensis]|uniref:Flagellar hook-associated protein 3 n=1 Tax=Caloramator mitchellensis TaxID=908809 RepID=A0A0R3JXY8_CALMK|nr:flagellar hook-associated protein FlgL [Caloramator mitchellensis]KRQ85988.1 Flagellar hook-associated protein 3 [Caloramator mitchellensis]
MRITNKVLVRDFLGNLRVNLEEMKKYQDQLSSGHEVRKPSDDPFKVARTMELKASIAANERYKNNIQEASDWLNTADSALGQIGEALQTIREKTIQGGNGAYTQDERLAIAKHIQQLKEQIMEIGNTAYDGRYIFGGDKTNIPPFKNDNKKIIYVGSKEGLNKELSPGVIMDISVKGSDFANDPATNAEGGIFETLSKIVDKLNNNDNPADLLGELDTHMNNILRIRAEVGAKQKRTEDMLSKNEDETFNMTQLLAKTYDIDIAKKVMEYKVMENIYTASLQTGAKILQPSLLDFLR